MRTTFAPDVLDRLRSDREVRIETHAADGTVHATVVWVVVDRADRVLVRSWRGAGARWYREATTRPPAALLLGRARDRVEVRVEGANDAERIAACSDELERKYAGDPATASMVRDEVLDTTLELLPA